VHVTPEAIKAFTDEMNAAGVHWQFHNHAGIEHGWTLPPGVWATEYDETADARSTQNMIQLLREIFPDHPPRPVPFNAAGAPLEMLVDLRLLDPAGAATAEAGEEAAAGTITKTVTTSSSTEGGVTTTMKSTTFTTCTTKAAEE
jgi:hypothetical protein